MPKHAVLVGVAGALVALLPATFGCGRPPTLLITAETLPAQSRSLAVSVTRSVVGGGEQATAEPLSTYDLPEPTPSRQSFLLRLPSGFSGSLNVSLAAFSGVGGAGCLQRLGFAAHEFAPQPYDDTLVLPLDLDPGDLGCESAPASLPRLIAASPAVVGTAGGDRVQITGWGFVPGTEVHFDGRKLSDVTVQSAAQLSAVAIGRGTAGPIRLGLLLPGGAQASRDDLLRYRFSTPSFMAQPSISTPFVVSSIAYGDIDRDGNFDVLLSPASGNRLTSILLNQQLSTSYSIGGVGGTGPVTPAILVDLDLDGRLDMVTGILPMQLIVTRRNSGTAAVYEAAFNYAVQGEPSFVLASDVDHDGYPDVLALSESGRTLNLLLNDGQGGLRAASLTTLSVSSSPFAAASLDLNLDGHKDIVMIDRGQAVARTLLNNAAMPGRFSGSDTVALVTNLSAPASSIVARDLDGDGNGDVLLAVESKGELLIAYSRPSLAVLSKPIPACAAPHLASAADLDADGIMELIVACNSERQVQVLKRRSDGSYQELLRAAVPASLGSLVGLTTIDYDGDGRIDIALSGSSGLGLLRNESM